MIIIRTRKDTRFEKYIKPFIKYLARKGFSERTMQAYPKDIRVFFAYLEDEKPVIERIDQITRKDIIDYQSFLYCCENEEGSRYCIGSQVNKLSAIKTFFRFLVREDYLLYNPSSDIDLPKEPNRLPRNILTENEVKKILNCFDMEKPYDIRNRAIIEILYSTGARASEVLNLTMYDIYSDEGMIRINQGKGNKDRVVAIGKNALKYVNYYIENARSKIGETDNNKGLLFITRNGKIMCSNDLSDLMKAIRKRTGITKHFTCHTFRHTCATHLLKHKANIRYIQQQLGHGSLKTTQKYLKVEIGDLKEVHRKCHPRDRLN